ncbi:MAG: DUF3828 domain-containing protein [Pseudomonadota bacterium]
MSSTVHKQILAAVLLAGAPFSNSLAAPPKATPGDMALIVKLYKDFAWQALGTTQDVFGKSLQLQDNAVLRQYFDPTLAALIVQDRECVSRRAEVCNMDFDPLFGSQDATVSDFTIQRESAGRIAVAFTSPSSGEKAKLLFHMKQSGAAWRINDVVYQDLRGASLRKLLATKLPGNGQR